MFNLIFQREKDVQLPELGVEVPIVVDENFKFGSLKNDVDSFILKICSLIPLKPAEKFAEKLSIGLGSICETFSSFFWSLLHAG